MSDIHMYGEVGTPANRFSPIGIQSSCFNPAPALNRVVILEPKNQGGYPNINDWFEEKCTNHKCLVLRGDIYRPDSLQSVPLLDLLVLENVLNDPCYPIVKNWFGLFQFLNLHIKDNGFVFIIDTITHNSLLEKKYRRFIESINGFKIVVDELFGNDTIHKQTLKIFERNIVVDDQLRNGFNHLDSNGRWFILQKTS